MVKIDELKCDGCGVCIESCPFDVLALKDEKAIIVKPELCRNCEVCVKICPNKAIEYIDK